MRTRRGFRERVGRALLATASEYRAGRALARGWREFVGMEADGSGGFKGAEVSRLVADWLTSGAPYDDRLRSSLMLMRRRARQIVDDNAYGKQFMNLLATNVIGTSGMRMRARISNAEGKPNRPLNTKLERHFNRWAEGPVTVDGRYNLVELEDLLIRTLGMDGEVFVRRWYGFQGNDFGYAIEPIDADLVDESFSRPKGNGKREVRLGIEVDDFGAPVAYHVLPRARSPFAVDPAERQVIPASEMIHVFRPDRVMQTRGVTMILASMFPLHHLDGYEEAELIAARVAAAKMGFFTKKDGAIAAEINGLGTESGGGPPKKLTMEVSPGEMTILPDGYDFAPWDPSHPTGAFPAFVKAVLRKAAAGLGVSYNAFANDLEGVNYSSMRSGLLIERDLWKRLQNLWAWRFRTPICNSLIDQGVLTGEIKLPTLDVSKYRDIGWIPRSWPWVDPKKDGEAAEIQLRLKITSRTRICAEQGTDLEDVLAEIAEEEELAAEYGIKFPDLSAQPAAAAGAPGDDEEEDGQKPKGEDEDEEPSGNGNGKKARNRIRIRERVRGGVGDA